MKKTKYIFISGGVISGIGKGVTSASICMLLKNSGYKVVPIKCENYLNIDAGTINPIEHGDPFLCEDGTEADMDIGTYEKFLNENLSKINYLTMGQIYKSVIEKERRLEYNGEDVQEILHITGEIIKRIEKAVNLTNADIAVIELGGTAGEYQNILYYEASRILAFKNPKDLIHIHVSYMPTPKHLGEPKSKPVQLSVKTLNSMGIQPDMLIARSDTYIDKRRKERFAIFCNLHTEDIFSNPDVDSIYKIPLVLEKQGITARIQSKLSLPINKSNLTQWKNFVYKVGEPKKDNLTIGIVGKYFKTGDYVVRDSYAALFDAIEHASIKINANVITKWINSEELESKKSQLSKDLDGIIVPIGWGPRGAEGMIYATGFARKNKIPFLGLCYGMQLAVISFARDILGWKDANTEEIDKNTPYPVIHFIPNQKSLVNKRAYGGTMRLGSWEAIIKKNTMTWDIYNESNAFIDKKLGLTSERHRHRYEFNDKYAKDFEKAGLVISARSKLENLVEIIELPKKIHPFYLGTQGHPEYKSRPLSPHPIFVSFLSACRERHKMLE